MSVLIIIQLWLRCISRIFSHEIRRRMDKNNQINNSNYRNLVGHLNYTYIYIYLKKFSITGNLIGHCSAFLLFSPCSNTRCQA